MEEFIVKRYFDDVKRSIYIFEHSIPRHHSFTTIKANIMNIGKVQSTKLMFDGQEFIIVSINWNKPHYFIINTLNNNIMWTQGIPRELNFTSRYSTVISLAKWIKTLQTLARDDLLTKWAESNEYIAPKHARKQFNKN